MVKSASSNAASGSPDTRWNHTWTLSGAPSCTTVAPSSIAWSTDVTAGRGSYSIRTSSAPSSAAYRSSATTATMGSPTKRLFLERRTSCGVCW